MIKVASTKVINACRLVTGEYVIAKVENLQDVVWRLEDPLLFQVMPGNAPGDYRVGFQTLVPLSEPGVRIDITKKDVMFWFKPPEVVVSQYETATSLIDTPELSKPDLKLV